MVGGQLIVQPNVFGGQTQLLQEMKYQFQLAVGQRLSGHAAIEGGHAHHGFAIQDRHRDLGAEQLKFLLHCKVGQRFFALAPQNASVAVQESADASLEGQFEMLQ